MKKKLSSIGNSLGLVIEKPILELLKISKETELEISTDGTKLIIQPLKAGPRKGGPAEKKTIKKMSAPPRKMGR